MYSLENNKIKISIKKTGAELCEISSIKNKTQFMWDANPDIWANYAPNLFPIIGALKNNTYIYNNKSYQLPKHGFIRNNKDLVLIQETKNSLTFKLKYNDNLLKNYPFKFDYQITYKLVNNKIKITYAVTNLDHKSIYFSLGGHPAFKCPVYKNENYNDYFLEFEHVEQSHTHLINKQNGLISLKTTPVFTDSNIIDLHHNLFNNDALIFKDLSSRKVTLSSKNKGPILTMHYKDFNYLGVWAKPKANFVCIEPWLGIADPEKTNQIITHKEGIINLEANKKFTASYDIEIHDSALKDIE